MKIGLDVENRENSGETMTLSMLCELNEFKCEIERRNVGATHDKHA